jgi:hypothetical protein
MDMFDLPYLVISPADLTITLPLFLASQIPLSSLKLLINQTNASIAALADARDAGMRITLRKLLFDRRRHSFIGRCFNASGDPDD